ncbi:hypothetical protein [Mycolicibacterium sp. P9-64]|uniref:hypothetical protein n=1 Tax=Mycolicibacterium sp. P9-64 TaxID=2024612 RepID=UPI0011EC00AD|nr:hypothetical protein [Mycolicibacterium sp. P9-64]
MAAGDVVDPAGVRWRVRRQWYPWRRRASLIEAWNSSPDEQAEPGETTQDPESSGTGLPKNFLLKAILIAVAFIVWAVVGIAKVLLYSVLALLFVTASLIELAAELIVMPIVLLLRLVGAARWPVQISRKGEHFDTRYADDFAAAAALRDDVTGLIEAGSLPKKDAGFNTAEDG